MSDIIAVATGNDNKLRELSAILAEQGCSDRLALVKSNAPDAEETGNTFLENARLKAGAAKPAPACRLLLAEDSGLVVDALAGSYGLDPFPGIYSNRWLTPEIREQLLGIAEEEPVTQAHKNRAILRLMENEANREAAYVCGMTLLDLGSGRFLDTEALTRLRIIAGEPRGGGGFGYDPVTLPVEIPNPDALTMAEIAPALKNRISHRGKAFRLILEEAAAAGWLPT